MTSDDTAGGNGAPGNGAPGDGGGQPAAGQGAATGQEAAGAGGGPSLNVLGQYIKDLSFENPKAPSSFSTHKQENPPLNVSVNVNANSLPESDSDVEVELKIEARAGQKPDVMFNVELVYAGVFRVQNVTQEQVHPLILIECPRLLFPFARQIVADTILQGGFPPLMLDPIDFNALYRQRMAQQQQPQQPTQST